MGKAGKIIGGLVTAVLGVGALAILFREDRSKYSPAWFESASDDELNAEREQVRQAYCSAGSDYSEAVRLENLLRRFDKELSRRAWAGEEPGYPVHREHGWYLPNDD